MANKQPMNFLRWDGTRYEDGPTATVNWTHMIDFDFSAVVCPIYGQASAEVKSYTQNRCCGWTKQWRS